MKKQLLTIASVAMIAGAISFSSCKKDDTTAPTITVSGGNTQAIALNSTWSNPSATATDDVDGDVSANITVTGTVDPNTAGSYTLTYTVADAAGNTATATVTVTVANDADYISGTYNVRDSVSTSLIFLYTMNITTSNTINNRINFNTGVDQITSSTVGFADYQNNTTIYATISGTNVILPSQTVTGIGTVLTDSHTFDGNGTIWHPTAPISFLLTYNDNNTTQGANATGCKQYYVHQ